MWFRVTPESLDFAARSPFQLRFDTAIWASPERVFDVVVDDDMGAWLRDFVEMRWTSTKTRTVGATRTVRLKGGLAVKERFLAWERGAHVAFAIEAISVPGIVRAMIEDFRIEPLSARHTRLRYSVHYAPHPAVRPVHFVARRFFGAMFHDAMRGIARVASGSDAHDADDVRRR
jgi:hypothetical protein